MTAPVRIALIAACASCASVADRVDGGDAGNGQDGEDAGWVVDAGPSYSFEGQVAHLDGTPWSNALVGLCSSVVCLSAIRSTEAGTFEEEDLAPDDYVADVTGDDSDGGSASPVYFNFRLESDLVLTSPIVVPETGLGAMLDGGVQTVRIDDSLSLTVNSSTFTWPEGEPNSISGIQLPAGDWPTSYASNLLDGGDRSILAVWALNPFQAASSTPIPVTLRNEFDLSAGSHAQLFGIDVTSGMPQDAIDLELDADGGVLTTLPGQGLTQLTWLLLVTEN
jgi:hypothetical protein